MDAVRPFTSFPRDAVRGGVHKDNTPIYVGRAYLNGDLIPCKVVPSERAAYVSWSCREFPRYHFEVLAGSGLEWVPAKRGFVPKGAICAGNQSNGESLYIGRAIYDGFMTSGKIHPSHGCMYIPYDGVEHNFKHYEVLVQREQTIWKHGTSQRFPENAVCMEVNKDDINVYMGGVMHNGRLFPAKIPANEKIAYVWIDGQRVAKHEFEVLCEQRIQWIPMSFTSQSILAELDVFRGIKNSIFDENGTSSKPQCHGLNLGDVESVTATDDIQLLNMNHDCLAEIASKLTISELVAYANTCTRLYEAARSAFKSNPVNAKLDVNRLKEKCDGNIVEFFESYLEVFGDLIKEVIFSDSQTGYRFRREFSCKETKLNTSIIELIVKYCDATLDTLQLNGLTLSLPTPIPGRSLFSNLRVLRVDDLYDLPENLNSFRIESTSQFNYEYRRELYHGNNITDILHKLVAKNTSNLESLELIKCTMCDDFIHTLANCSHLKKLRLLQIESTIDASDDLSALSRLTRLEDLTLDIKFKYNTMNTAAILAAIGGTESMQRMDLGITSAATVKITGRFTNLRALKIGYFPDLPSCFDQSGITELTLDSWARMRNGDNLLLLVQALENLTILKLQTNAKFNQTAQILDLATFNDLATLYHERHQKLTIECSKLENFTTVSDTMRTLRLAVVELKQNNDLIVMPGIYEGHPLHNHLHQHLIMQEQPDSEDEDDFVSDVSDDEEGHFEFVL